MTGVELADTLASHYGLTGVLKKLPGYEDQNYLLSTDTRRYVVKVSTEAALYLDLQNQAMTHLFEQNLAVPQVIKNQDGGMLSAVPSENGPDSWLRVLTYLEGSFYADITASQPRPALWQDLGRFLGTLDMALEDFRHPGACRRLDWDLAQGHEVCQRKIGYLSASQQRQIRPFLQAYQQWVIPRLGELPRGVIHNDANDYNLLVNNAENPQAISGLIDFGDMLESHLVNELAIACAYAILDQDDIGAVILAVVRGYHSQRPLTAAEADCLFYLIGLRLCVSVCNSARAIQEQPDNQYLLISARPAWSALEKLGRIGAFGMQCRIRQVCGFDAQTGHDKASIQSMRKQHFSRTLSLSYREPLKIVRGQGAYLFDEHGRDYLDMVNNVCHVGHCHPYVVAAAQRQMASLNTNTRYLHDNLVDYGQRLLATFPEPLSVCFFVNSGSEANELAFRLARCATGRRDLLVVDGAYHGNTNACIEASSYKFDGPGGEGAASHVHKVPLPYPYRGRYQGDHTASAYAQDLNRVVEDLEWRNTLPGAFICESLQGVAGQIVMPEGYLQQVYTTVRDAGAVCIADEVQVGFGRVGQSMWGFQTQQVVPDIVTLGKPIGNGHPMAAVVTTPAIADAFVTGMEYFNTFGGNPVSCAIGMAVLEVLEQEQLVASAQKTGDYLKQHLAALAKEYACIGDIRGLGLFLGVELVTDPQARTPATEQTAWLIEFFKSHRILLSSEGPDANVLKIKPPMVFGQREADRFLDIFNQGLATMPALAN
ncbi:aminotransferase class III-fold pyridoxal phosphate-dependent enzyme [Lacimicrobium alkaliphilum]|uniref:Class III aminotransferase n=1 Tax=Lacimicrobium alkaliphilum TaxID=1526571 RepID=A0A0U3B624_9ALTE|nr:aminotransferase class III-fold pyridoxal phosphate-dependent enzyme [Lacimicrobium alkaliphilum]ALS97125.1 class III aminotransferase [Lacimicrobium alkaliphilum]